MRRARTLMRFWPDAEAIFCAAHRAAAPNSEQAIVQSGERTVETRAEYTDGWSPVLPESASGALAKRGALALGRLSPDTWGGLVGWYGRGFLLLWFLNFASVCVFVSPVK
jgi:hypothetical protein